MNSRQPEYKPMVSRQHSYFNSKHSTLKSQVDKKLKWSYNHLNPTGKKQALESRQICVLTLVQPIY